MASGNIGDDLHVQNESVLDSVGCEHDIPFLGLTVSQVAARRSRVAVARDGSRSFR
jgi:hypothetical protein